MLAAAVAVQTLGTIFIKALAAGLMAEVVQVKESVLEEYRQAEFLVIRQETVVNAPFAGRVEKTRQDGERVARGAVVGYLTKTAGTSLEKLERIEIKAPQAGMVFYKTDGYEGLFGTAVWPHFDPDRLADLLKRLEGRDSGNANSNGMVEAGRAMLKIVNNLEPMYLFAEFEEDLSTAIKPNGTVELRLGENGYRINGQAVSVSRAGNVSRLLIKVPGLPELQSARKTGGRLILRRIEGVVLDGGAVVVKNGREGVYLVENGIVVWREANLMTTGGKLVAVKGLSPGEWFVTTPHLVKEGQRLFKAK